MRRRSWFQRLVEWVLPWYDPKAEEARDERSEAIHREAIAARIHAEGTIRRVEANGLRGGYDAMGKRLQRR